MIKKILRKVNRIIRNWRGQFWIFWNKIMLSFKGIRYGKALKIRGHLFCLNEGNIQIGNNVRINSAPWTNPVGGLERMYIQVMAGDLYIGDNVGISNSAITVCECVKIGNNVLIGGGCKIYDTDFHPIENIYRFGDKLS